jgi:hypothetical protein
METKQNSTALGEEDIFRYFGLGCRNVSNFFVQRYSFDAFFEAILSTKT